MTHLVLGASGLVGSALMRELGARGLKAVGTYLNTKVLGLRALDMQDSKSLAALLAEVSPKVIFWPAFQSNVDWCERNPEESERINLRPLEAYVSSPFANLAKLVFYSSDYVFDGKAGPYSESDPTGPINVYGIQKLKAEELIQSKIRSHVIVRTTFVYGRESNGKNFAARTIKELTNANSIRVPSDQVGNPSFSTELAERSIDLVTKGAVGLFNVVGRTRVSKVAFALRIANVFGLSQMLIEPCSTSELRQVASRPLEAGLRVDKIENFLNCKMAELDVSLNRFKGELNAQTRSA